MIKEVKCKSCFLGTICWKRDHFLKFGWFRIFGKGLKWKHESEGLLFSERNGYIKYLKVGNYIISRLQG